MHLNICRQDKTPKKMHFLEFGLFKDFGYV